MVRVSTIETIEALIANGWTASQIARALDCERSTVHRWKSGQTTPSDTYADALTALLDQKPPGTNAQRVLTAMTVIADANGFCYGQQRIARLSGLDRYKTARALRQLTREGKITTFKRPYRNAERRYRIL